jgi:UDP-glucose 4-epimerase
MRAFVSGGAGFIGSHLVAALVERGQFDEVVIYDNFSSGTAEHIAPMQSSGRVRVVAGDLKELATLSDAMRGADVVFHLAANPDIAKAVTKPDIDFWEGTFLAQNVLEAMRVNEVRQIFYTSGSGVYGDSPQTVFAESYGPCFPISTYGASKLACEALISAYCHMFGFVGRAFRFANVVGPRQTHGVGYDFIRRLGQDPTQLRILGDGSQCKAYIHVDDVLNAIFLVAQAGEAGAEAFDVFNVATDDYVTVREIADLAVAESGLTLPAVRYEFTGGDRGWKGDVPKVLFDVQKIRSLGWRATRSSSEALRDSLRSMIAELDGQSASVLR